MPIMRITDGGGIHNSHGPNDWLREGCDYVCRTVTGGKRFVLRFRRCTDAEGDYIWLCVPDKGESVVDLLPDIPLRPLSASNFVEIEIQILAHWPAD